MEKIALGSFNVKNYGSDQKNCFITDLSFDNSKGLFFIKTIRKGKEESFFITQEFALDSGFINPMALLTFLKK